MSRRLDCWSLDLVTSVKEATSCRSVHCSDSCVCLVDARLEAAASHLTSAALVWLQDAEQHATAEKRFGPAVPTKRTHHGWDVKGAVGSRVNGPRLLRTPQHHPCLLLFFKFVLRCCAWELA